MAQIDKTYLNEMQKQLGYFAAWSPSAYYELGDYADMQGDQFEKLGNIKKWITPKASSRASGSIYYVSSGDVSVNLDFGAADATKQSKVDLKVSFDKKYSIFFLAQETTTVGTQNLEPVGDKIVDIYKKDGKDWKLGYVWIEEIIKATFLTVLISVESNVSVTLSGKLPVSSMGAPVANLDLSNFSVTKNKSATAVYQVADATPLFRLYEVKDPITKKAFYTEYK
jgi:hypothetical protein